MANVCPAPGPDDPLVRSLLVVVDCNTQELIHAGYSALFQGSSAFGGALTTLLTLYVALIGYQLLLGRSQWRVTDFALTAVKIGAVLALATQWDAYQAVVYRFLFSGPEQLAGVMAAAVQPDQSAFRGDVFDGLQRAFNDLSGAANTYSAHAAPTGSPLVGGVGFGAVTLTLSATTLLLSSLGVLLASKVVLGLLLAVGPLFIALFLFDATRGLFEGWLRASLAFAFAPLAVTLLLSVILTMLEPSLLQMEELGRKGLYPLAPVYSVAVLVLVFAGVSLGAIVAGGMIASGLRLPSRSAPPVQNDVTVARAAAMNFDPVQSRATRVASAAAALERRDIAVAVAAGAASSGLTDRRTSFATTSDRAQMVGSPEPRLGQAARRSVRPRTPRNPARSA